MPLPAGDLKMAQRIALLSVVGQHTFYNNLSNFLGLIGHWAGDAEDLAVIDEQT
jgi:hypothetical protein